MDTHLLPWQVTGTIKSLVLDGGTRPSGYMLLFIVGQIPVDPKKYGSMCQ